MQVRYDPEKEIYRDCKWCSGRGCLGCKAEADKAYKAAFPDGPVLIATFDTTTPDGVEDARKAVGREAIERAYGPGGGGTEEIIKNCLRSES